MKAPTLIQLNHFFRLILSVFRVSFTNFPTFVSCLRLFRSISHCKRLLTRNKNKLNTLLSRYTQKISSLLLIALRNCYSCNVSPFPGMKDHEYLVTVEFSEANKSPCHTNTVTWPIKEAEICETWDRQAAIHQLKALISNSI